MDRGACRQRVRHDLVTKHVLGQRVEEMEAFYCSFAFYQDKTYIDSNF